MCFLPMENSYNWYLISIMPKSVLQQESSEIIRTVGINFLKNSTIALVLITALLFEPGGYERPGAGPHLQRAAFPEHISEYRFCISRSMLLPSRAWRWFPTMWACCLMWSLERWKSGLDILFIHRGVPKQYPERKAFFKGALKEKVRKEYKTGTDNELQRWTEVHFIPADDGQYLAVMHDTTVEHHMRDDLAEALRQAQRTTVPGRHSSHPCPTISVRL